MGSRQVRPEFLNWYAGKRVFLTGHTGFKGAWLSLWLKALGTEVTGYALPPEAGSLFATGRIDDGMMSIEGDIRDAEALSAALAAARPDIVFHMAAQSLVRPSYDDPVGTFATNAMGTANLLQAVRRVDSIRSVVIVTSDKCYENDGSGMPFIETAAMGGDDPYSASKGCTELVTQSFARSFFGDGACTVASGRAGNVIGGGDWSVDRIIPDLMRSTRSSQTLSVRRPDAVRPWQHVLEPLRGYLMLGHRAAVDGHEFAGGWNFGPRDDDAVPVRTIVEKTSALWPDIKAELATVTEGPHEAATLRLDCRKANARLGWHSALTLDDALAMTVAWYREAASAPHEGARIATRQIHDYQHELVSLETI